MEFQITAEAMREASDNIPNSRYWGRSSALCIKTKDPQFLPFHSQARSNNVRESGEVMAAHQPSGNHTVYPR